MNWFPIAVTVAVVVLVAVVVHFALTWANKRGWVYYRNPDAPKGSSLGLLEEIYQPSITHVIDEESRERTEADQSESGDPEAPATPSDPDSD